MLAEVPAPGPRRGALLIETECSLVSAGTERMLVDFGKAGWLGKARKQPEKVRQVLAKARAEGAVATWRAINAKLSQPIPLGYCNVGVVLNDSDGYSIDVNSSSESIHSEQPTNNHEPITNNSPAFRAGDRVISNGPHAEVTSVNLELCCRIPDGVANESAAFTPLAAIALEGIDLLAAAPGEKVIVTGLGLIGQLAVRILLARGCEVMGLDPSAERRELARRSGATVPVDGEDPAMAALNWSEGGGVAGVVITASAASNDIVNQAARSCRRRGKVVLVGVVGLLLNRADFYRNEVSFQVSNSYGLRDGIGVGSVRANFSEILRLMDAGKLKVDDLITHRFAFTEAGSAYAMLSDPHSLGILMRYAKVKNHEANRRARSMMLNALPPDDNAVALIGAGNFAVRTLLPALTELASPPSVAAVASSQGAAAWLAARQFGASRATTDTAALLEDTAVRSVFLTTRHDAHAKQAEQALRAGKNVWVEKPLALRDGDVLKLIQLAQESKRVLMVGFNRRFSPLAVALRDALRDKKNAYSLKAVINAGRLPSDHWTLDSVTGGGRIVGEGCHWIDLLRYLVGEPIVAVECKQRDKDGQDGGRFELEFSNGVKGLLDYRTDLPAHIPKEYIEVDGGDWTARIENWIRLKSKGMNGLCGGARWGGAQRKGHPEALKAFLAVTSSGESPIPLDEIEEVSRFAIAMQSMKKGDIISAAHFDSQAR